MYKVNLLKTILKKIKKWGNSLALRILKREAEQLNFHEDKEVKVETKGGNLSEKLKDNKLRDLLEDMTEENLPPTRFPSDKPRGKEVW